MSYRQRYYIYRVYDADCRLLYIGQTLYPEQRIKQHARLSHWFAAAAEWDFTEVGDWWQMVDGERVAIADEAPLHNIRFQKEKEVG